MPKRWSERTVRKDGTVKVNGRIYKCRENVKNKPDTGDRLLFFDYQDQFASKKFIGEHDAPADTDGHIMRMFWDELANTPPIGE